MWELEPRNPKTGLQCPAVESEPSSRALLCVLALRTLPASQQVHAGAGATCSGVCIANSLASLVSDGLGTSVEPLGFSRLLFPLCLPLASRVHFCSSPLCPLRLPLPGRSLAPFDVFPTHPAHPLPFPHPACTPCRPVPCAASLASPSATGTHHCCLLGGLLQCRSVSLGCLAAFLSLLGGAEMF